MENSSLIALFLAFCSFYVYMEKKIEKEIKKTQELIDKRYLEIFREFKYMKLEMSTEISRIRREIQKTKRKSVYNLKDTKNTLI